jgi:glutamate synthase domain-containing protein 3
MSNLGPNDPGATEPINPEQPQPARHGQIHVHPNHPNRDVLIHQMAQHLAQHVEHLKATADYHRPDAGGAAGQSSGAFQQGGASGADYQTTSTGTVGDADSGGTGY